MNRLVLASANSGVKTLEGGRNDPRCYAEEGIGIKPVYYQTEKACPDSVGRVDEAMDIFDRLAGYGNHLGLLSEDVDGRDGSQWGNFPQAYSHVGLVNAAYRISNKLDRPNFL